MQFTISIKWPFFLFIFGLGGTIITTILAIGYYEKLIAFVVASQTRIIEGTPSFDQWQKIPIPVYLKVRMFNVTNPKEVENGGRPIVTEMGPYVYKETMEKFDITFNKENDTVRYRQVRFYYFQPEMSNGRESDMVTLVNLAFVSAAKLINDYTKEKFILSTFEEMLVTRGESLFMTHPVIDILFNGFSVQTLIELANSNIVKNAHKIKLLKPITKFKVPQRLANGKMGMLEGRNGSDEGWFEVRTGIENSDDFGRVVTWNGLSKLKKWQRNSECDKPKGTDGIIYQPFLTKETELMAFVPDACRSLFFKAHETTKHGMIETYRFRQPKEMYYTPIDNPDNACYCPTKDILSCPPKGILSVATCFEGAPIVMSQPHFLDADPIVQEAVGGLSPDPEKHWGYLDLHPMTGLSVEVRQKVQFAIEMNRWPAMPAFSKLQHSYIPIMWAEEGGDLEGLNLFLLSFLDVSMGGWQIGKWGLVGGFGLLTVAGFVLMKRNKAKPTPTSKEEESSTSSADLDIKKYQR